MNITPQPQARLLWVDWMKIGATMAVIYGHFFAKGDIYTYVFSLQSFCVISGLLYKKPSGWKACLTTSFWSLLVPTIILSVLQHLDLYVRGLIAGEPYAISWSWYFKWLLLGHRWCMGPCWYFYTFFVIRLLMQLLPQRTWAYVGTFIVLSAGAITLHQIGFQRSNSIINVVVCMPLFLIGLLLRPLKGVLGAKRPAWTAAALLVVSAAVVVVCGEVNGYVWMYLNGIGRNYALYILGGVAGTAMLYAAALLLCRLPFRRAVVSLSSGTMLVIGLHIIIVRRLTELPDRTWGEDLFFSLMIVGFFLPVVMLAERYFPLLIGRYKG